MSRRFIVVLATAAVSGGVVTGVSIATLTLLGSGALLIKKQADQDPYASLRPIANAIIYDVANAEDAQVAYTKLKRFETEYNYLKKNSWSRNELETATQVFWSLLHGVQLLNGDFNDEVFGRGWFPKNNPDDCLEFAAAIRADISAAWDDQ